MHYSLELIKHTNIRYREAALHLARCELAAMLAALEIDSPIREEMLGGVPFCSFSCRCLSEEELGFLSRHSAVSLLAERQGDLLRPLSFPSPAYLPEDLPEVLKYKGKTNATFTRMMINMARSLLPGGLSGSGLTLLDPLCGKGTALFVALVEGMNAAGLDRDTRAIHEATDYFSRYLRLHRLKHERSARSETLRQGHLSITDFRFSDTKEHFSYGETRRLQLACGDTSSADAMFRRSGADLIVADLPYGIQHAPMASGSPESFPALLRRSLPAWKQALIPGGVLALSFNVYTLPVSDVITAVSRAGFVPCLQEPFVSLEHEVEQAVKRDLVFAINPEGESLP